MKHIYLLFVLLIGFQNIFGQQKPKLLNVNFQAASIDNVVNELQDKTGYKFYYDAAKMAGFKITAQGNDLTLDDVLNIAFKNTDYHFAVLDKQVFITKGRALQAQLLSNIGSNGNIPLGTRTRAQGLDFTDDKSQPVLNATLENKFYDIGIKTNSVSAGKSIITGYVHNVKTGEPISGAFIAREDVNTGVYSDQFGYYSITLPKGQNALIIRGVGLRTTRRQLMVYTDGKLNIDVQEQVLSLKQVNISAKNSTSVEKVEMGVNKIDIKSIKQVPTAFGESDILKVVLTLPGVQSVGESSTGLNVRGGAADQNLILLNDATIYNPSHFFGFFSSFDPDIVKDVELYKSSIPEKFGGRLSSVLDVTNREGNKKDFTGSAGIGLITSRFNIEGPIDKDKTSFILGARTTYANWLLNLLPGAYKNSTAGFYDVNFDISHQINEKNSIYLTTYISSDNFKLNSDTSYRYSNKNVSLKWKHVFNNKLFALFTGGYDRYQYSISSEAIPVNGYQLSFNINQTYFKTDFTYYVSPKHTIDFGVSSLYYKIHPGTFEPDGAGSLTIPQVVSAEQALESAIYVGDHFDLSSRFSVNFGFRYSLYNYLGPQTVRDYAAGGPKTTTTQTDSITYGSGKNIKTYGGPEYRISTRYSLSDNTSIKAAYNTLKQYIHLLSNTTAIAPTDVWKLSDPNIKPQYGDQVSLGIYHNLESNTIELSAEVYYKRLKDYLDFKSGANVVLNQHVETDVLETEGKAYGVELFLKKTTGKVNGWISYTYSRTFLKDPDPTQGALINNGNYYPADFDKPNAFNFIGNYRVSHRFNFSLNVTYSTGRPITLPIAKYYAVGSERVIYSDRNAYRIPDYFRSDLGMNIDGNHKIHQRFHNSWSVGVYNLTGRANPYSVYYVSQGSVVSGYQLSIFSKPIPYINYNIRF